MLNIYLTCPYTYSDKSICREQFDVAAQLASQVIASGELIFSPVLLGHPIILQHTSFPTTSYEEWALSAWEKIRHQAESLHSWADALLVVDLEGTSECTQVQLDIALFRKAEKPVRFVKPTHVQNQLVTLLEELKRSKLSRL
ncbi:DUF1937 family protein [Halodesulfovibrio marinisediminis]|uniref:DUF1937 domain-containing protein n=1 Tax=Halodesulfovibrio marinisediminis DSM 17456 TaxID=1121457 RepID=A0A1N6FFY1_9BACT|nr:DUF1937 family protein [Halodesulfovibrio marinisediminis]SIN94124.1 protein of unknown function [Halodesulfovibrio marinisediminis DSM 17456]